MAAKRSAGVLLYRRGAGGIEVLLVHPGGPFWARRDEGAWSIPKGEIEPDEDPLSAGRRELAEETGGRADGPAAELPPVKQPSGKVIHAFAVEGDLDAGTIRSNTFEMEWPRGSGALRRFPEVDRAAWMTIAEARRKILPGQEPLLDHLMRLLSAPPS
jgi:predicted NUDIX family NTP pyrophosphohydrolase